MSYTCVIVDDEPLSHEVLKNHLKQKPEIAVVGSFFNATDASAFLENNQTDLLFLDIEMPEVNGLELLRSLKTKPITIVTTAFRDYAIEGFELGVIDYLLKPVTFERFDVALRRAAEFLTLMKKGDTVDFNDASRNILIKTGTKKILIDYRSILYAQGLKDYTILHTKEKKYVVKGSVKAFEEFLPSDHFMRVHRSFMIAKDKIKAIQRNKIEFDGLSVPIGRSYREQVDKFLKDRSI